MTYKLNMYGTIKNGTIVLFGGIYFIKDSTVCSLY